MRFCIPVLEDKGLDSPVSEHFGSAPLFLLVDDSDDSVEVFANQNTHHGHGMCRPLESFRGHSIDAVVVSGIGGGAMNKLRASGIDVLFGNGSTVKEILERQKEGGLRRVHPGQACAQHRQGRGGCSNRS
jgi:predicted Fe-Mo cluster-binding NifX family protein